MGRAIVAEANNKKSPKRRIVRKVETVREKAEKSSKAAEPKHGIVRKTLRVIATPFRFVGRQLAKLGRFKVFRIIGLILVPPYFRNSWKELRQVTWPTGKETRQLTLAVLMFSIVFGVLVTAVDYGFDKLFKRILLNE